MKMNKYILAISTIIAFLLFVNMSSAITVNDVEVDPIGPGQEGRLEITIKNTLNDDVEEVSLSLDLTNLPFTTVGSSEYTQEEITENDKESFVFRLRADATAKAGDYKIPYTLTYKNASSPKKGTIGVRITAKPDISYTISTDSPVVGTKGKINLKLINTGLGEARFVVVKISPIDYTLLSDSEIYIGSVDSDDFESATFDVIFNSRDAELFGTIEYRDIENKAYSIPISSDIDVYTNEEAIKQGIIKKSNAPVYITIIIILIIVWIVWRAIAKRRRLKKSMQAHKA